MHRSVASAWCPVRSAPAPPRMMARRKFDTIPRTSRRGVGDNRRVTSVYSGARTTGKAAENRHNAPVLTACCLPCTTPPTFQSSVKSHVCRQRPQGSQSRGTLLCAPPVKNRHFSPPRPVRADVILYCRILRVPLMHRTGTEHQKGLIERVLRTIFLQKYE